VRACLRSIISQLQDKNGAAGKNSTQVHLLRTQRENKQRRNLLFLHNNSQSCSNARRESKKNPLHTQRDNKRRFIQLFSVLAKCPSHSARRESKSSSWSTKSRSKLEEHSGLIKISNATQRNATQGFVLIRNATTTAIQEQNRFDDSFFAQEVQIQMISSSSLQQKKVSCNYLTRTDGPRGNRLSAFSERVLHFASDCRERDTRGPGIGRKRKTTERPQARHNLRTHQTLLSCPYFNSWTNQIVRWREFLWAPTA